MGGVRVQKVTKCGDSEAAVVFARLFVYLSTQLIRMNATYSSLQQQRALLLNQMAALDRMERGRLSEQFLQGQKDGQPVTRGPYYVLQRRLGREILKERVPLVRLPVVQADINAHEEFQRLAGRYAQVTEEMTHLQDTDPDFKKKPSPSKPISSRKPRRS